MRFCEYDNCSQPVWGTDRATKKGYCKSHQWCRTDLDKRSIVAKAMDKREKIKVRSLIDRDSNEAKLQVELNKWYAYVATIIEANPRCWETKEPISKKDYRNATAHIFPKSIFPSVATHPLNFLVLSARNGSHDKTHRLDTFSKMKVFPLAVERFNKFKDKIKEKHKYLDMFQEYANKLQNEK